MNKSTENMAPEIGVLLKSYIKEHRIYQAALSRKLGINKSLLAYYKSQESMQTKTLWKVCFALKHNFFMDLAQLMPPEFGSVENLFEEKNKTIAALEEKVKKLELENQTFLKILKDKKL